MVRALSCGPTVVGTKANGRMIKLMARASWSTQTAMSMKENGLTTKLRVTAPTVMRMAPSTRAPGSMTSSTGKVLSRGPMVPAMKANTLRERKRVTVV